MTHDVTRSRIDDPDLRRRIERAAAEVVAYVNRGGRLTSEASTPADPVKWKAPRERPSPSDRTPPAYTETSMSRSKREILTELRNGVSQAATAGRCGVSRQYVGQVVAEFHANGIDCGIAPAPSRSPEYSPLRRSDEAD